MDNERIRDAAQWAAKMIREEFGSECSRLADAAHILSLLAEGKAVLARSKAWLLATVAAAIRARGNAADA